MEARLRRGLSAIMIAKAGILQGIQSMNKTLALQCGTRHTTSEMKGKITPGSGKQAVAGHD